MNKATLTISGNIAKGFSLKITIPDAWLEKFGNFQKKWLSELSRNPFTTITEYGVTTYIYGFIELDTANEATNKAIEKLNRMKKTLASAQDVNETVEVDL